MKLVFAKRLQRRNLNKTRNKIKKEKKFNSRKKWNTKPNAKKTYDRKETLKVNMNRRLKENIHALDKVGFLLLQ